MINSWGVIVSDDISLEDEERKCSSCKHYIPSAQIAEYVYTHSLCTYVYEEKENAFWVCNYSFKIPFPPPSFITEDEFKL